jgi:hypothetical protein
LPVVLIIDQSLGWTGYLRTRFHEETSVGVLVANDLTLAKNLLDQDDININAMITELFFEEQNCAPDLGLWDGVDMLLYCKQRRPSVNVYVLSFFADSKEYRQRTESSKLDPGTWLHKMVFPPGSILTPWAHVERDLIKPRIERFAREAKQLGWAIPPDVDEFTDIVRKSIRIEIRTYIQSIRLQNLTLKKPIEVICSRNEDDSFRARARKIGLFLDGVGETVEEALEDLELILSDYYADFATARYEPVGDYAQAIWQQLATYVTHRS